MKCWNDSILNVFHSLSENKDSVLFAATGDIDNLGIYVAQYGRASAENLVDCYTTIITEVINNWCVEFNSEIYDFSFSPNGEEFFLIGSARTIYPMQRLFDDILPSLNSILETECYLHLANTRISFGTNIFDAEETANIATLSRNISTDDERATNGVYFHLLKLIRTSLALRLDAAKFSTLSQASDYSIFYRNIAYKLQYDNKINTRTTLQRISKGHRLEIIRESAINLEYGLVNLDTERYSEYFNLP